MPDAVGHQLLALRGSRLLWGHGSAGSFPHSPSLLTFTPWPGISCIICQSLSPALSPTSSALTASSPHGNVNLASNVQSLLGLLGDLFVCLFTFCVLLRAQRFWIARLTQPKPTWQEGAVRLELSTHQKALTPHTCHSSDSGG